MKESAVYAKFAALFPGSDWHIQRIETTTGRGVPDISLSHYLLGELWVELKAPAQANTMRPEQYAWAVLGNRRGRLVLLVSYLDDNEWEIVRPDTDSKIEVKKDGIKFTEPELSVLTEDLAMLILQLLHSQQKERQSHV